MDGPPPNQTAVRAALSLTAVLVVVVEGVVDAGGDAAEAEGAVLLVVDGGGGVVEVHGAEGGGVDGVLRVVHPEAVGDPAGVGGRHVLVGNSLNSGNFLGHFWGAFWAICCSIELGMDLQYVENMARKAARNVPKL